MLRFTDFCIVSVCITGVLAGMLAFYWEAGLYSYLYYDTMQRITLYSFFVSVGMILISIMRAVDKKEEIEDYNDNPKADL